LQLLHFITAIHDELLIHSIITNIAMDLAQLPSRFVHLRSSYNLHVCCHSNYSMNANREEANMWEIMYMRYITVDKVTLLSCHGTYVCAESDKFTVKADRKTAKDWETWEVCCSMLFEMCCFLTKFSR